MKRRTFLTLGAAATVGIVHAQRRVIKQRIKENEPDPFRDVLPVSDADFDVAVKILDETTMYDDDKRAPAYPVIQREIDRMAATTDFLFAIRETSTKAQVESAIAKYPVMRWYNHEFDRTFEQFTKTTVTGDRPAIWYLYNMGLLVKTKTCSFGIDICHRNAVRLAPYLDFLLVTHNHGDHKSASLISKMTAAKKPIISNFHLVWDWYCRDFDKTFKFKDITIHCTAADHNKHLSWAVTNFEVVCGDAPDSFTIFHSGDCCRADHLKPRGKPDIFFGHCAIGLNFMEAAQKYMPAKMFVPLHHQELAHLAGPWRCVAFEDEPLKIVETLRAAGHKSFMPVWGDRIV